MTYHDPEYPFESESDEFDDTIGIPIILLIPATVLIVALFMIIALLRLDMITTSIPADALGGASDPMIQENPGPGIAPLFTPEVQYWNERITTWGQKWGVDPKLIATVIQIESCGDPKAVSSSGAMGLFQVMPYHFEGNDDPFKPGTNALRGIAYLKNALDAREGDARLGLAGYNAGITGAKRPESSWPAETIRYVYWGTGIYADALAGKTHSDRLDEWLSHGGAHLCNQAAKNLGLNQ
jgi:hypothetical protein